MTENVTNNIVLPPVPPKKPLWRRVLRYSLITTSIIIGLILLSAILIPLLFEDQIKRIFINELNKNLATAVVVDEKDIELSILKNFPDASVVFNNIGIMESFEKSDKKFLEAEEISLVFNIMNIIRGNYVIQEIIVTNGNCNLISDKRGNINYKFWKDTESESTGDFSLDLQKVVCKNVAFSYRDFKYKQDIILTLHDAELQGNFSSDQYKMLVTGDILSKRIHMEGSDYLVEKETTVDASIDVDVPLDKYSFNEGSIIIDKNKFLLNGSIALKDKNYYDLAVEGDEINLKALTLLLPGTVSKNMQSIKSTGNLDFKTIIKGYSTSTETPLVEIKFAIDDGSLQHEKFGDKLTDVSLDGVYSNGDNHNAQTSYISIQNFKGKQNGEPLSFSLDYRNFKNPTINLKLNGNLPASFLLPLAMPQATDVEGIIGLQNINISGNVKAFNYIDDQPTGNISFKGVAFTNNNERVTIQSGTAEVNNNEIIMNELVADLAGTDLLLNLHINNWIQTVFPSEVKPALIINGTLNSKQIDLNKLLAVFRSPPTAEPASREITAPVSTDETTMLNFSGMITASVSSLTFNQLKFNSISTTLKLTPGMIVLNHLKCSTMGGTCELEANFRELSNGNLMLETTGTVTSVDIGQLFEQFENFDQTTLTSKNIRGVLSANIYQHTMLWDKDYHLIENSIYNKTNMKIENGELLDYKPLESLSGFVDIKELRDVKFSTLENEIEIKDRWIYIPAMKIESSAMDLFMSGKHSFDNQIDYQFKLSLADVLVRKFLGGNKQQDNYEEDAEGGVNVFVSMTGTVANPEIRYNKKEAKQKLKESGMEEQKFIDIFKPDPDAKLFKQPNPDAKRDTGDAEEIEFIEFEEEE